MRYTGALDIDGDEEACMSTVPTPTTVLPLDEINPASFDFCRANLNEPSSAGTSMPSESLNPTARFFGSSSGYKTLIESPFS